MEEHGIEWTLCGYDRETDALADEIVLEGATGDRLCELLGLPSDTPLDGALPVEGEMLAKVAQAFGKEPSDAYDYFVQGWSKS